MPRVQIPVTTINPFSAGAGGFSQLTFVAFSAADDHYMVNDGRTLLLSRTETAGASSYTVLSVVDINGRIGDVTVTLPGYESSSKNSFVAAGPFVASQFNQGGGRELYVDTAASTAYAIAGLRLPIV